MHYIKYKEQELPVAIDFSVIKIICNKLNLKLSDIEQIVNNPTNTEILFKEAIKRGCKLDSKTIEVSDSDVEEILNENYGTFLFIFNESILKLFTPKKKDQ